MQDTIRLLLAGALLGASTLTTAAAYDGSAPLLCALTGTVSCEAQGGCIEGPAEAVNLPVFLKIDLQKKVAQSLRASGEQRSSEILSAQEADDALVLLGVDQGAGWSTRIGKADGKLTLSVSGPGIGFIAFGACIPE